LTSGEVLCTRYRRGDRNKAGARGVLAGITRRLVLLVAAAAASALIGSATPAPLLAQTGGQQTPQPTATIGGRVVDATTGSPLAGVTVAASGSGPRLTATTDSSGRFAFDTPGGFAGVRLSATAPGYASGHPDQLGPTDSYASTLTFDVPAGNQLTTLTIRLWAEASVSGHVEDQRGNAVPAAVVDVLSRLYAGTGPLWQRYAAGATKTDDHGNYMVAQLQPGEYLVAVRPPVPADVDPRAVAPTYFPGVGDAAAASVLRVDPGGTVTANVTLDRAATFAPLAGRLTGADRSLDGAVVHLVPANGGGPLTEYDEITATVDGDGAFRFRAVPAGDYRLKVAVLPEPPPGAFAVGGNLSRTVVQYLASGPRSDQPITLPPLPDAITWVADVPVATDGTSPAAPLSVPLRPGATIGGRVVFDGTSPAPGPGDLLTIPVVVRPADGGMAGSGRMPVMTPQPRIEADGRFRTIGLAPGDYVLTVAAAPRSAHADRLRAWSLTSVRAGGRETIGGSITLGDSDIRDVVVTMTDQPTEVWGVVHPPVGQTEVNARVIIFPRDPAHRVQSLVPDAPMVVHLALPDRTGAFRTRVLPGDYLVAAVTSLPANWMTPEHLQTLVGLATEVRIAVGERKTVTLTAR